MANERYLSINQPGGRSHKDFVDRERSHLQASRHERARILQKKTAVLGGLHARL